MNDRGQRDARLRHAGARNGRAGRSQAPAASRGSAAGWKPRIGDEPLRAKTGKSWAQWFALLDRAGAAKLDHTAIAAYLHERLGCPGWWNQTVAVGYEQARGLRGPHQRQEGYSVTGSKMVEVPIERLDRPWTESRLRARWLDGASLGIRKATANRSLRITWGESQSLSVWFSAKGTGKSQVVVQHEKLPDAAAAARAKAEWKARLEALSRLLLRD